MAAKHTLSLLRNSSLKLLRSPIPTLPSSQTLSPISRFSVAHLSRFFSSDRSDSDSALPDSAGPISDSEWFENTIAGGESAHLDDSAEVGEISSVSEEQFEELLSLLRSTSDGSLEKSFSGLGLSFDDELVVRILESPQLLTGNLIALFRWLSKEKPEFVVTSLAIDSLVLAVSESGLSKKLAYSLWDLVKEVGDKRNGAVKVESLNQLIALFSELGKAKAAAEVFDKFVDFEIEANEDTFYFTVEALCRRSMFDWAWSYCQKLIDSQILPDTEKIGKIILWFCKGKSPKEAHSVYLLAKEKKQFPPRSSISFLISSLCSKDETVKLAFEMLDDIEGEARKYAIKQFSGVIRGLCRTKETSEAKNLLLKMIEDGPPPGNAAFNSVIHGFSKAGEMGEAIEVMNLMKKRGLKPDVYTYTVVISGYTSGGQMAEARKILAEAKKKHSKLSPVTYHTLIRGYCKLEAFDKALELLSEMKKHGVEVNADEYNKLIQSLCLKALDWETAEKLLEEMKEKGLYLNGITRGLVRAVKEMVEEEVVVAAKA